MGLRNALRALTGAVGVDGTQVFYRAVAQPQIDRSTFQVEGLVMRDAQHVYFPPGGQPQLSVLEGADPLTFRYLLSETENPWQWAKDAHRLYYQNTVLEDADRENFEIVQEDGRWFARDRHGSFFMGRRER